MEYSPTDGKYMYRIYAGKKAIAEEKDGVVKFYHKDHLGSTRVVTDAAGTKVAEYKFAPYGEKEVASGEGTEYGFTDKAEDVTTGLKYFGARFYDAECGRFLSIDPKKDGLNWYRYANDNPIKYVDPDGKKAYVYSMPIAFGHVHTFIVIENSEKYTSVSLYPQNPGIGLTSALPGVKGNSTPKYAST